jgi:NAD(P)-dependent dehydrogenase (short-subunit alcohol dehydrogenase family)
MLLLIFGWMVMWPLSLAGPKYWGSHCENLFRRGAKVMIADLNGEKAEATAEAIQAITGNQVLGIGCNVTVEEDIQQCVAKTVAAFGGISTLVNNVGWGKAYDDPLRGCHGGND